MLKLCGSLILYAIFLILPPLLHAQNTETGIKVHLGFGFFDELNFREVNIGYDKFINKRVGIHVELSSSLPREYDFEIVTSPGQVYEGNYRTIYFGSRIGANFLILNIGEDKLQTYLRINGGILVRKYQDQIGIIDESISSFKLGFAIDQYFSFTEKIQFFFGVQRDFLIRRDELFSVGYLGFRHKL